MGKILLSGHNKYWGTLERATEFWLKLGINHAMIKWTEDTRFIENGQVVEKEFERYQRLQERYGVKYHLHPYELRTNGKLITSALKEFHPILKNLIRELDEKIHQYKLYSLITVHLSVFASHKYNLKVDERVALENGKEFFQNLSLKSKLALEIMHAPYKDLNAPGAGLLGYKAEHFRGIIGDKDYGLCIDVGHLNMVEEPLEKFLELPYPIYSAHLHGNDGTRDEHRMATKTNVKNFKLVKKMLKQVKGPVVLEIRNYGYSKDDFEELFELWGLR